MYFSQNEELLRKIVELDKLEVALLVLDLMKCGKLNYVELSKIYVDVLEQNDKKKTGSIESLGLMLGAYCMTDQSNIGKAARKHLYESGMYGHNDGCKFGQMLDEEFSK